jgi:hypothetical protein
MATIIIHWKDKNLPAMEIKNAAYKGADSSVIKITSNGNEYWFNWNECWFLETKSTHEIPTLNAASHFSNQFTERSSRS